jgi:hypothetical protein
MQIKPKKVKKHFHVYPTPLATHARWKARDIRRHLERDQLKRKLPKEYWDVKFVVVECIGNCMEATAPAQGEEPNNAA